MTTVALIARTPFRGNDETQRLVDSRCMAHRTFVNSAAHAAPWLHRLHLRLRSMRADAQQTHRLPLLRLAGAVLVALLALGTASGLLASVGVDPKAESAGFHGAAANDTVVPARSR